MSSLFRPDSTNMANVAHFMCEMVRNDVVWDRWSGQAPGNRQRQHSEQLTPVGLNKGMERTERALD